MIDRIIMAATETTMLYQTYLLESEIAQYLDGAERIPAPGIEGGNDGLHADRLMVMEDGKVKTSAQGARSESRPTIVLK